MKVEMKKFCMKMKNLLTKVKMPSGLRLSKEKVLTLCYTGSGEKNKRSSRIIADCAGGSRHGATFGLLQAGKSVKKDLGFLLIILLPGFQCRRSSRFI